MIDFLGKEKDDFFSLLGGKTPYSTKLKKNDTDPRHPRLFHCSLSNGCLRGLLLVIE